MTPANALTLDGPCPLGADDPPAPQPEPAREPAREEARPEAPKGATAVAERPKPARPKLDHLPPFRVLLHDDPEIDMEHVVETLVELTPLPPQNAVMVMLEAHKTGVSLVLVTHKERAELYVDQFHSKKLTVTIEPAE